MSIQLVYKVLFGSVVLSLMFLLSYFAIVLLDWQWWPGGGSVEGGRCDYGLRNVDINGGSAVDRGLLVGREFFNMHTTLTKWLSTKRWTNLTQHPTLSSEQNYITISESSAYHSGFKWWLYLSFFQCIPVSVSEERMLPNISLHTQSPLWLPNEKL